MIDSKGCGSGVAVVAWGRGCPRVGVANQLKLWRLFVDTDLDTLATALYVSVDDLLKDHPDQLPERPAVGIDHTADL